MEKSDFEKYKIKIPKTPGVYYFRDGRNRILYVGKATNLRERVRSYFTKDLRAKRGPIIDKMIDDAKKVDWESTDSALEALILEANLIKKYNPKANTQNKDNKSFNYVVITKEDFPRVLSVRGRELFAKWSNEDIKRVFGPFPKGGVLKNALAIVRKVFPFRDKCAPANLSKKASKTSSLSNKPCFYAQIGLCPGVCAGFISQKEYNRSIRNIILLFEGKKKKIIQKLKSEMRMRSKNEEYEKAKLLRDQIADLEHISDARLLGDAFQESYGGDIFYRVEAFDVAHIAETARVGAMAVLEDGAPAKDEYRKFNIKTKSKGDTAALYEVLKRRFKNDWRLPNLVVVDGGIAQINVAKRVLKEFGHSIPIVGVIKDRNHKPKDIRGGAFVAKSHKQIILLANQEAHRFAVSFHRSKRAKMICV